MSCANALECCAVIPREVCPHVFMRANDKAGSPTRAAFARVGVQARDLLLEFACELRAYCCGFCPANLSRT